MKRDYYYLKSYDGEIIKEYRNYKSAYNAANKLIRKDIDCGIYVLDIYTGKFTYIIGC